MVGLAYASKLINIIRTYNTLLIFHTRKRSAFGTIGNASTSEGLFFEAVNAAGVLQVPMLISVWDDEYGISVPAAYQTTKGDISKILSGFQRNVEEQGYEIFRVRGWDYPALCDVYRQAARDL
jgi:TPP-dependent pyruvate/acetoin dehydrogenase alpha subunit